LTQLYILLRPKWRKTKWFIDIANEIQEDFSEKGTWEISDRGFVWTHRQHGGKVRFYIRATSKKEDILKVWHPNGKQFENAQAIGDFVQWIHHRAKRYVKDIRIRLP